MDGSGELVTLPPPRRLSTVYTSDASFSCAIAAVLPPLHRPAQIFTGAPPSKGGPATPGRGKDGGGRGIHFRRLQYRG